jgi:hypothetical protein
MRQRHPIPAWSNYAGATNQLVLYNDAVAASVTASGTNPTLNLPVTFTAAYTEAKNTYMYAAGSSAASGWQMMGSWTL